MADIQDLESLEKQLSEASAKPAAAPASASKEAAAKDSGSKGAAPAKDAQAGKKAAKAAPKSQLLWTVRVEQVIVWYRTKVQFILKGLVSRDPPTRRMAALFLLSSVGLIAVLTVGVQRILHKTRKSPADLAASQSTGKHLGDFIQKTADEARLKAGQISLGIFTIELKPSPDQKKTRSYVFNLAELEIHLSCDSKETRDYIEENLPKARNQITNYFTAVDRSALMTREGKRRIKDELTQKLNLWLPRGKIEEIYFTKFVMN